MGVPTWEVANNNDWKLETSLETDLFRVVFKMGDCYLAEYVMQDYPVSSSSGPTIEKTPSLQYDFLFIRHHAVTRGLLNLMVHCSDT